MTDLITRNLDGGVSVARLGDAVGMKPRAFSSEFREATGFPVHQYILSQRVERAVELLTESDLPLSQVAAQAGFSHQAHMSRVLRRLKNRSPRQLRSERIDSTI